MRNGLCPKCGTATIFAKENGLGGLRGIRVRIANVTTEHQVVAYVCVTCGYSETYVTDRAAIDLIRRDWTPILPADQ